jgi:quinol monooxygenase YgiN
LPYIRLSIMKPRPGEAQRMEDFMRKLTGLVLEQEGCIESYLMKPHDDSGEIARIAIYTDEQAAENSANSTPVMALRSEIHLLSEPGHIERAFFSV